MFASHSSTLVVSIMTIVTFMVNINNLRVVSNDTGAEVDLLVFFLTVGSYDILALLKVGDIYNDIILNITFLVFFFLWFLLALFLILVVTMRTTVVMMANMTLDQLRISSAIHKSGGKEDD